MAKRIPQILIFLAALLITACDPGLHYQPKDWSRKESPWFAKSFGGLEIEITDMGGLIVNETLLPEMKIYNRAGSPATLERAILKAGGTEYVGKPSGEREKVWESVPPNETRRLTMYWKFDKPIYEILKDPVELVLMVKIGDELKEISIPMVKEPHG